MTRQVLIVDDDELVLELVSDMLADLGCDVRTAASGSEALQVLRESPLVEVLLSDVNMPGIDGKELGKQALEMRPRLHVILLSGGDCAECGFPLIKKPLTEMDIERVMKRTTGAAC